MVAVCDPYERSGAGRTSWLERLAPSAKLAVGRMAALLDALDDDRLEFLGVTGHGQGLPGVSLRGQAKAQAGLRNGPAKPKPQTDLA